jgi:hypothetical protein
VKFGLTHAGATEISSTFGANFTIRQPEICLGVGNYPSRSRTNIAPCDATPKTPAAVIDRRAGRNLPTKKCNLAHENFLFPQMNDNVLSF